MANTLYSLTVSHPALAVRAMLEHKGIEHRVVDIWPGMHPPVLRLLRFPGHTVPALVLEGRRIQGSRAIARALDEFRPDPPLFPVDPDERCAVQEAERWGDEVLQAVPRRIFRWMCADSYAVRRWLAVDAAGVPLGGLIARPPLQARLFARAVGADAASVRADVARLPQTLAHVSELLEDGVIGGALPNAADFQIAASLRSLGKFADLEPHLDGHPAVEWAATVVPPLPGPMPAALPREWLEPLVSSAAGVA